MSDKPACLAYALATSRCEAYYFDVAADWQAAEHQGRRLDRCRRLQTGQKVLWDRCQLVWHEDCGSEAAARARMAEVRALPHAWQRRLIEAQNPYWLDQAMLLARWPMEVWWVVPEAPRTRRPDRWAGPIGVPPAAVAELKAHYGTPEWFFDFPSEWLNDPLPHDLKPIRKLRSV